MSGNGQDTPTRPSMATIERRAADRVRQSWQPHPDQIKECAAVATFYGCDLGPFGDDVIRRVLAAAEAWQQKRDAEEREHQKRRGDVLRAAEMVSLVERVSARRKVAPIQNPCAACDGRGGFAAFAGDGVDGGAECSDCGGTGVIS